MENIIKDWIENKATDDEIIQIVSEVNSYNSSLEEYTFYDMEFLNEFFDGVKPTELLSKLTNDFNVNDDGYRDTIYGLESCSKYDAIEEIKNNSEEVAEEIANVEDDISLPESLQEMIDEMV